MQFVLQGFLNFAQVQCPERSHRLGSTPRSRRHQRGKGGLYDHHRADVTVELPGPGDVAIISAPKRRHRIFITSMAACLP